MWLLIVGWCLKSRFSSCTCHRIKCSFSTFLALTRSLLVTVEHVSSFFVGVAPWLTCVEVYKEQRLWEKPHPDVKCIYPGFRKKMLFSKAFLAFQKPSFAKEGHVRDVWHSGSEDCRALRFHPHEICNFSIRSLFLLASETIKKT